MYMRFHLILKFFSEMLLSCYFIVLVSYFGCNNALTLFIYLSLLNIIILFRLNYFIY